MLNHLEKLFVQVKKDIQVCFILLFLLHVRSLAHGQQRASFTDSLEAPTRPGSF
jgi:hypothetical protein